MPQFHMIDSDSRDFASLDPFTRGYIEALFFTSEAPGVSTEEWQATEDHNEGSIPCDVGFSDLAPETLKSILADCGGFQWNAGDLLPMAYERGYSEEQAGHDFWLTRNHHGAGFWDRKELEPHGAEWDQLQTAMRENNAAWTDAADKERAAEWDKIISKKQQLKELGLGKRLTDLAHHYREVNPYLGDDGKVYL